MKLFLTTSLNPATKKKGYYGGISFLDNQNEFKQDFGLDLVILPEKMTINNNFSTRPILQNHADKYKFDISMYLCMLYYVGEDKIDPNLNIQEVCRRLSDLKQKMNDNGRVYTDTPDELVDKYISLVVSLPNDAVKWPIQLCSAYLSALTSELASDTTDKASFSMPDLTSLPTKALQIEALRKVRSQAAISYKSTKKAEKTISTLLRSMHISQHRGLNLYTESEGSVINDTASHGQLCC